MYYKMTCRVNFLGEYNFGPGKLKLMLLTINVFLQLNLQWWVSYRTTKICCILLTCSWLQQYTGICRYFRFSHATINSTKYAKGSIIVYSVCDGLPVFGKITDILVTNVYLFWFLMLLLHLTCITMHMKFSQKSITLYVGRKILLIIIRWQSVSHLIKICVQQISL